MGNTKMETGRNEDGRELKDKRREGWMQGEAKRVREAASGRRVIVFAFLSAYVDVLSSRRWQVFTLALLTPSLPSATPCVLLT